MTKPKAVVLDGYGMNPGDLSWDALAELCDVTIYDRTKKEEILPRSRDAEILLTNKTQLNAATLAQLPHLRYITVLATGYNIIDVAEADKRGVAVSNVPEYSTDDVAQTVMALLLEICQHVGHHSEAVHAGRWEKNEDFCFWDSPLIGLSGKTMGIIGEGRIGKRVRQLAEAFGMKTLCTGSRPAPGRVPLERVLTESDVITLHCPLTPETKELIRRETIEKMKPGVILINTARGGVIRETDLRDALLSGRVYAAGVDVLSTEPPREGNPLIGLPNCIITPHIAWASLEARTRLMRETVLNVASYLQGEPRNRVH